MSARIEESTDQPGRGFFGRDLLYVGLWAAQLALTALLTPVITRLLGPSNYGIAATCVTLMQLVTATVTFGLVPATQRLFTTDEHAAGKLVTLSAVIAGVALVILSLTGTAWCRAVGFAHYGGSLEYAVAWGCVSAVTAVVLGYLRSTDNLLAFALVSLTQSVLAEALSLVLVLVVKRTSDEYILGELLGQVAAITVGLCFARPALVRWRDRALAWSSIRYGAPIALTALVQFVFMASDRLVINRDLGHVAAARYAVAATAGSVVLLVLGQLSAIWMPRVFAETDDERLGEALMERRDHLNRLLVPATVGLAMVCPLLLRLWAPSSYRPDHLQVTSVLIALSAFPVARTIANSQILMRDGRTRTLGMASLVAAVTNLTLNLALVPAVGIVGSAASLLAVQTGLSLITSRMSGRTIGLAPSPRTLVVAMAAACVASAAVVFTPTTLPILIARAAVAVVCGVAAVWAVIVAGRSPRLVSG